jgi:hypothetical protein
MIKHIRHAAVFAAALLLPAVGGCRDATGSSTLMGTHELASLSGSPLPAETRFAVSTVWGFCTAVGVVSGSLELNADGSFEVVEVYLTNCGYAAGDLEMRRSGTYRVTGDRIEYTVLVGGRTEGESSTGAITRTTITLPSPIGEFQFRR